MTRSAGRHARRFRFGRAGAPARGMRPCAWSNGAAVEHSDAGRLAAPPTLRSWRAQPLRRRSFAFVIMRHLHRLRRAVPRLRLSVGWAMLSTAAAMGGPAQVILVTETRPGTAADRDRRSRSGCRACGCADRSVARSCRVVIQPAMPGIALRAGDGFHGDQHRRQQSVRAVRQSRAPAAYARRVRRLRAIGRSAAYCSGGIGNGTHLSMAYFLKLAGLDMIHVPLQGRRAGDGRSDRRPRAGDLRELVGSRCRRSKAGAIRALCGVRRRALVEIFGRADRHAELRLPPFKTMTWIGLMALGAARRRRSSIVSPPRSALAVDRRGRRAIGDHGGSRSALVARWWRDRALAVVLCAVRYQRRRRSSGVGRSRGLLAAGALAFVS